VSSCPSALARLWDLLISVPGMALSQKMCQPMPASPGREDGLWASGWGTNGGTGAQALTSCWKGALASPFPCPSCSPLSPSPLPSQPSSYLLQGAILTTMLATRNFSGRLWGQTPTPSSTSFTDLLGALSCWIVGHPQSGVCKRHHD
jgi:hypothetical protein